MNSLDFKNMLISFTFRYCDIVSSFTLATSIVFIVRWECFVPILYSQVFIYQLNVRSFSRFDAAPYTVMISLCFNTHNSMLFSYDRDLLRHNLYRLLHLGSNSNNNFEEQNVSLLYALNISKAGNVNTCLRASCSSSSQVLPSSSSSSSSESISWSFSSSEST